MYSNKHDPMLFDISDGIKIYTGTTTYSRIRYTNIIEKYDVQKTDDIFTTLEPSTLTAKGQFTDILFNEEELIKKLTVPDGGYIIQIGCNFGELSNKNPNYTPPPVKKRISNRGRKPKAKPKSNRKLQGTGKYFSSQITFFIYCPIAKKIYKIKLFRNGGFQVPGVNKPNMHDLINPIKILNNYLCQEFNNTTIKCKYFISVMRNYICKLKNPNLLIKLNVLENILEEYKLNTDINIYINILNILVNKQNMTESYISSITEYIGHKHTVQGMAEIQHNCERYFGLIIKFYRPVPWKMTKRTTIKVLRSGKINIDGGNSIEECYSLYHWLASLLYEHKESVLYDVTNEIVDSDEYSVGSGCSIYDDEL